MKKGKARYLDEIEALMKVLVVISLIIFGISAFGQVFCNQYEVLLSNVLMFVALLATLGSCITLYAINTVFPHRQETKKEKNPITDLKGDFTHIIALIITVPLIVVACILLVDGNHSEELTFISGLLGIILGYYFGQRGVESAESKRDIAMNEKYDAVTEKQSTERVLKGDRKKWGKDIQEDTMDTNKEILYSRKENAWRKFKEQYKEKIKKENKDFKEVENIDKYLPWEKPEGDWSAAEKDCIRDFEEEWELLGGEKAASLGGGN